MNFIVANILDLENKFGEADLNKYLSDFSCGKNNIPSLNEDIEIFLKTNSLDFSKQKKSITYLIIDRDDGALLGYFTIAHKPIVVQAKGLSNTALKRIERFSELNRDSYTYNVSAFLIAQFGKNFAVDNGKRIDGKFMMELVDTELKFIQHRIGGGIKYLDCEPIHQLISFYHNCGFKEFSQRKSRKDNKTYLQLFKFV